MSLTKVQINLGTSGNLSGSRSLASSSLASRITTAEDELGNTLISSSAQLADDISGSFGSQRVGTSDSPTFNAITVGTATITGTLTAQEVHTEFESASILFTSGSTKFGDTIDDTHEVTGSMTMSGSVTVNDGNLVVLDSLGIGTNSPTFAKLDINAPTATNADNLDQSVDRATLRVRYRTDETDDGMFFGGLGSNHGYIQGVADASNDNTSQAGKNIIINPYGGNVGVGTQTMDGFFSVNSGAQNAALHVESTDSNANISMADNAGSVVIAAAGNEFIVETGGSASTAGSGASERFRIDSSGNVGIGTNNPGAILDVDSGAIGESDSEACGIRVTLQRNGSAQGLTLRHEDASGGSTDASEGTSIQFQGYDGSNSYHNLAAIFGRADGESVSDSDSPGFLTFHTTPDGSDSFSERMRITKGGFVGIGTDNPDSYYSDFNNLVVYENGNAGIAIIGGTNGESSLGFGDGTGAATYRGAVAYVHTSGANQDKMFFKTAATNRVVIDSSGQVGIGVSDPDRLLELESTGDCWIKVGSTAGTDRAFLVGTDSNHKFQVYDDTSDAMRFTIDTDGEVGIGTTSPDGQLEVVKDGGVAQLRVKSIGSGDDGIIDIEAISNKDAQIRFYDGGGFNWRLRNKTDTNNRMELFNGSVAGVFINDGSTSWSGTSDERVKDNIVEIKNATDKLKDLRCVSFNWTWDEDKTTHLGLLAQDVEKVFPEVVSGDSSKDIEEVEKDGLIEKRNVMGVEYTALVPVLIKSVQELTKRIEELEK